MEFRSIDKACSPRIFSLGMTENEILIAARLFQSANPEVARKLVGGRARGRARSRPGR